MKIAFIMFRKSAYHQLSPIIQEALRHGWPVECWHDYRQPRTGFKGYQFPDVEHAPTFSTNQPVQRIFHDDREFDHLQRTSKPDAIVSLAFGPRWFGQPPNTGIARRWIVLQHMLDAFSNQQPEEFAAGLTVAVHTPWWITWGAQYYAQEQHALIETHRLMLADRAISCGLPELDVRPLIDPAAVRRRWKIPEGRPVVLVLPFHNSSHPGAFWARHIYLQPNPLVQAARAVWHNEHRYWPDILRGWNDRSVIRAIRRFCDRHGAFLLVKSRLKTTILPHLQDAADLCVNDESLYPPTILEALSVATLCINFYSAATLEAAAFNVPCLNIHFSPEQFGAAGRIRKRYELFFHPREGGPFQFTGVSTTMTVPEAIARLPQMTLTDWRMDAAARQRYLELYVGPDDGQNAQRLLAKIAQRMDASTRGSSALSPTAGMSAVPT